MPIQELNIHAMAVGKQTAKGTPLNVPVKRLDVAGGDWNVPRDDGQQKISDLTKYGTIIDWANNLLGRGNPEVLCTPEELAYLLYLHHGAESVTSPVNEVQTLTSAATGGNFQLSYKGQVTAILPFNATIAAIDAALEALAAIGVAGVVCAGGPLGTAPVTVTFNGASVSGREVPTLQVVNSSLSGGTLTVAKTTPGAKSRHRFTPPALGANPFYPTWHLRLGNSAGTIRRQAHADVRSSQLTIAASQDNKPFRLTNDAISLDPGIWKTADPTWPALPTKSPFYLTDAAAAFTIDTVVLRGHSGVSFVLNEDLQPVYSDDVPAYEVVSGDPGATISPTFYIDQPGQEELNLLLYGTRTPTADQRPTPGVPPLGTYSFIAKAKDGQGYITGDRFDINIPGAKWAIPDAPGPNPTGGIAQVTMQGGMRIVSGQQLYTVDVYCDDVAYT